MAVEVGGPGVGPRKRNSLNLLMVVILAITILTFSFCATVTVGSLRRRINVLQLEKAWLEEVIKKSMTKQEFLQKDEMIHQQDVIPHVDINWSVWNVNVNLWCSSSNISDCDIHVLAKQCANKIFEDVVVLSLLN